MLQSFITFPTPNTLTDPLKSCFCPLTTSNTWISPCVSPNLCYAVSVNALVRQVAALGPYACPTSPLTSTLAPTVTTATASSPSDSYPYVPTKPSGPLTPLSPSLGGSGATSGGVKESGTSDLAAAATLVVVCFVVVGAVVNSRKQKLVHDIHGQLNKTFISHSMVEKRNETRHPLGGISSLEWQ
ncbi:hypothetical protein K457DRAFT_131199 [Linnemannia elongata AG-77]|uniref:Uncharacterized protein n=1 Tax=Linnemannia elongata AG-77 TaxID=1314771 RepID=A0A197JBT8_9FUNG|nr:hypothetical protein K457DRAFT_131199 [Linnemannia elongata AG-77]